MTTFDEREQGFERKFALEQEQEFKATARRNRLLGEWAAELMGLASVDDYARAVVKSDFEQPGDEDVLRKVAGDLKGSGGQCRRGRGPSEDGRAAGHGPRPDRRRRIEIAAGE
jgi:hypothetical protein